MVGANRLPLPWARPLIRSISRYKYGFMRRNFNNNCPSKIKKCISYTSMMRPSYSGVATLVMFGLYIVIKIYSVRKEFKGEQPDLQLIVTRDNYHSITGMMQKLNWPTLKQCRNESKLVMMYKIICGHVHIQSTLPLVQSFSSQMVLLEAITINIYTEPATMQDRYLQNNIIIFSIRYQTVE